MNPSSRGLSRKTESLPWGRAGVAGGCVGEDGTGVVGREAQALSQWSTSKLDEAARRDIEEAGVTRLHAEAFDSFCRMLEEPMPRAARELLTREEIWT